MLLLASALFYIQYLNGDLLNGIYWEESYNAGDDNEYVCPGVQVNNKTFIFIFFDKLLDILSH